MVDISAPQPRLAPPIFTARRAPRTQSLPSAVADDTFYCAPRLPINPPPRLLSPYRLPEDACLHKLSKPSCSPTKKRRVVRNLKRSRHRSCARTDCCINTISRPLTSLDDLPWISALSIEPDHTNPWDIADLSLLDTTIDEEISAGPGPVRRRKTSLRSDPLAQPTSEDDMDSSSIVAFPFVRRALFSETVTQTPLPKDRFDPSRVNFHGLHPIIPLDIEGPRSMETDASP